MNFSFSGLSKKDNTELKRSNPYNEWRLFSKSIKRSFAIIPSDLMKYINSIQKNALNLYLYYCFHANNDTGESWHSVDTCAKYFEVSNRSINNWNERLVQLGLIFRVNTNRSSTSTFLLPISNYISYYKKVTLEEYLERYENSNILKGFNGKLKAIANVFQFRKENKKGYYTKQFNTWLLIFERTHKSENQTFKINRYVLLEETGINDAVDFKNEDIREEIYLNSSKNYSVEKYIKEKQISLPENIITNSLVLNSKFDLKSNSQSDKDNKNKSNELLLNLFDNLNSVREKWGEGNEVG